MPSKWSKEEVTLKQKELFGLYVSKNMTIGEISTVLSIGQSTVYQRLLRLKIKPIPHLKKGYKNHKDTLLPKYSGDLAECIGILLGDGHLSETQVCVTLGSKENKYVSYVARLFENVFRIRPKLTKRGEEGYSVLYFGSVKVLRFLKKMGLVNNKVKSQVKIPRWIFSSAAYKKRFIRGLFDTDGSVYKLKFGSQVSFCNRSMPLLKGANKILTDLEFGPSNISGYNFYITKREYLKKFFEDISPANLKKYYRLKKYLGSWVSSKTSTL